MELDATTARFDERGIADPLIGTVHDPIYQGAGSMGIAGIPQPKLGAVTKAHGGMLFIDEIGELHLVQMNKLLKVLEDRKVFLESAYYNSEDPNIPLHIHDMFQNGLPADFRLVGATTRMPEDIPAAIRSRCVEIYFHPLLPEHVASIALNAVNKLEMKIDDVTLNIVKLYASNGRDAVNMIQIAAGLAINEGSKVIDRNNIEWVVNVGQYSPRPDLKVPSLPQVGYTNGLAVYGANIGTMMEVEVTAVPKILGQGNVIVTGVAEEEEIGSPGRKIRRKSMVKGSVENVLTVLDNIFNINHYQYDIHVNFCGGGPIDGPSAGVTIATAIYSAVNKIPVNNTVAMTGELSIRGYVKPVGGVSAKVSAARQAGAKTVIIPAENWQDIYSKMDIEVIPVKCLEEVFTRALLSSNDEKRITTPQNQELLSASGITRCSKA